MADNKLQLKCPCGGVFTMSLDHYINAGGVPNEKGQVYTAQVQADLWLKVHERCLDRAAMPKSGER